MNKLNIYKNILPNYQNSTYYYFSNTTSYLSELTSNLLKSIDLNNYRINGNTAQIKIDNVLTLNNCQDITYLIEYNAENTYFKCYYVNSIDYQSGYVNLSLSVDFWATYIYKANIKNLIVSRCNRNIDNGIFDVIKLTNEKTIENLAEAPANDGGLYVLVSIMYATGQSSILVNNASTAIKLYGFKVNQTSEINNLRNLVEEIAGIYSAKGTIGDLDASVLKVFIVPNLTFRTITEEVPVFNSKTPNGTYNLTPDLVIAPSIVTRTFQKTIDPNYKYIAGTEFDGLEIINKTNSINIYYDYITNYDGLKVMVRQGDKSKDITSSFECVVTTNDGNFTQQEKINKGIALIGGMALSVASPNATALTASLAVANTFNNLTIESNGRVVGNGDGLSTWLFVPQNTLKNGLILQKYKSITNESENADLKGCIFNKLIDFATIFDSNFIGANIDGLTYIQGACDITNIPVNAMESITNALLSGIRCKKL